MKGIMNSQGLQLYLCFVLQEGSTYVCMYTGFTCSFNFLQVCVQVVRSSPQCWELHWSRLHASQKSRWPRGKNELTKIHIAPTKRLKRNCFFVYHTRILSGQDEGNETCDLRVFFSILYAFSGYILFPSWSSLCHTTWQPVTSMQDPAFKWVGLSPKC